MADESHEVKVARLEEKVQNLTSAINLQAKEYERRLTELNHAHAQAAADKNKFLTTEIFYTYKDSVAKSFIEVTAWQTDSANWRSRVVGITIALGTVGGIIGGILMRLIL